MGDVATSELMTCPVCLWEAPAGDWDLLTVHFQTMHAEDDLDVPSDDGSDDSGGRLDGDADADADDQYTECPVDGCDLLLPRDLVGYHLDLHAQEEAESSDQLSSTSRQPAQVPIQSQSRPQSRSQSQSPSQPVPPSSSGSSGPSRAYREAERHRRAERRSEAGSRQSKSKSKSNSFWRRLLMLPASPSAPRSHPPRRRHDGGPSTTSSSPAAGNGSNSSSRGKRLGRAQLGKYAHEERMPDSLRSLLLREGQILSSGMIPVLAHLLDQSKQTKYAYLCHPCVYHVSKLKREGGFCGYRNIQMLSSYIVATQFQGHEAFAGAIPSIFDIQDFIEKAWDNGFSSQGRVETGGIKNTRKYIGTPEALAMLNYLKIPCNAQGIKYPEANKAEAQLMDEVEKYFESGVMDPTLPIRQTRLPPIYFQHRGHSMTIVGFEKLRSGAKNLIVFDPFFHDSPSITALRGKNTPHPHPDYALKPYRRGSSYLRPYREFEVLMLQVPKDGFGYSLL